MGEKIRVVKTRMTLSIYAKQTSSQVKQSILKKQTFLKKTVLHSMLFSLECLQAYCI